MRKYEYYVEEVHAGTLYDITKNSQYHLVTAVSDSYVNARRYVMRKILQDVYNKNRPPFYRTNYRIVKNSEGKVDEVYTHSILKEESVLKDYINDVMTNEPDWDTYLGELHEGKHDAELVKLYNKLSWERNELNPNVKVLK